ncbi:unnamed protein product [Euphydryas editha]|uniref:Uncharacterized protein n=1 Tax=Euphydryas editha TaxID=104508 RepID=A0AAU9UP36_EUPED|nr:unnamed protein product [Euphydryas editha]
MSKNNKAGSSKSKPFCSSKLIPEDVKDHYSIWNKLFDEEIPELNDLDIVELKAFNGLLFYSAVLKPNYENMSYLFLAQVVRYVGAERQTQYFWFCYCVLCLLPACLQCFKPLCTDCQ